MNIFPLMQDSFGVLFSVMMLTRRATRWPAVVSLRFVNVGDRRISGKRNGPPQECWLDAKVEYVLRPGRHALFCERGRFLVRLKEIELPFTACVSLLSLRLVLLRHNSLLPAKNGQETTIC